MMIKDGVIRIIQVYQVLSSLFPSCCRFYPCCSEYAILALQKYGLFQGLFLTTKRLLRCHPFNPGGYDPVR